MQKLLELLVKTLVTNEDKVEVTVDEQEKQITFNVVVDESDIGKVIGKNGKMANSIRTIIKSIGAKEHKKVFVKFGD
ncbi:MAG TPA: KH domain-containing protein [Candidatus Caccovivens faecavium]|nr:KH domain-containing protein [Candidatus Caccovivens faecavium]